VSMFDLNLTYVTDADHAEYHRFCLHHLRTYGRPLVPEVWHYTTADAMMKILEGRKIFATQVTCLNDNREQRYFGDLFYQAMKPLGQWRDYGGGECGYAIGFRTDGILEALRARPSALFLPMQYADHSHRFVVDDALRMAQTYFLDGIKNKGITDIAQWAREFVIAFAMHLDIFASTTKHPAFQHEMERRIVAPFQPGDVNRLEFRQKRTLLARHLPIDLTIMVDGECKVPISRICVGPGPAQRVTQVSVGDLLLKYGYKEVPVELSAVPYRTP
jgi:hypothetical protein